MSYTVIDNDLLRSEDLKANAKILLLILLSYENKEDGFAYPSHSRLIKETGLSKVTLLKCLNELEERGYVTIKKSNGENNKYYINANIKNDTNTKISTGTKNGSAENSTDTRTKISTLQILNTNTNNKKEKEKEKKKTNLDEIIEAYTENDSLKETIKDFIKMRKTIKKPITDRGLKGILNKLNQYGENDLEKIEILENSIMNCWQGVFELKNKKVPTAIGTQNKNNNYNSSICTSRRKYTQACDIG